MKKTIYGILLVVAVVFSIHFKSSQNENLQQASFWAVFTFVADFEFSTQNCVCKGSSCSEANWVSFRQSCGSTTGGQAGNTNTACGLAGGGC